jgi:hypothetical protein
MNQIVTPRKEVRHVSCLIHLATMLAAVLLVTGHIDLAWPLDDPFQEGEWAISRPSLVPPGGQAVLIHGGLDQAPATVAEAACPASAQIACLRTINLGVQLLAGWSLVGLVAMLTGLGSGRAWLASLPTLLVMLILGAAAASPVAGQQSAPGTRDLPMFAALVPMILIARRLDRCERPGWVLPALLGAVAAAAPLWTYNRGIVTIVVAAGFLFGALVIRRSSRTALHTVAGGLVGLMLMTAALGPGAMGTAAHNIVYWAQNGGLWRIAPHRRALAEAALPFVMAILVLSAALLSNPQARRPSILLSGGVLAAIFVLTTAQSMDRADAAHLRWTLWPTTLLLAIGIRALPAGSRFIAPMATGSVLASVLAAAALAEPGTLDMRAGWRSNLHSVLSGWPPDNVIAGPGLTRIAALVRAAGRCTFAADNAGIVSLLARQPPCSRFAVGAYIAPSVQDEVITSLEATQPSIILWDGPAWWAHIDGHRLADHAPALAAWIVERYPVTTSIEGHIIRTKMPLPSITDAEALVDRARSPSNGWPACPNAGPC